MPKANFSFIRISSCGHHLFRRYQPVIAAVDVFHLRGNLFLRAEDEGFYALVVRMTGNDHALPVEHLEDRKFGKIAELAVLQRHVGQQDRVGSGLEMNAVFGSRHDQTPLHQMFDRIFGTAAEHVQTGFRDFDPVDAPDYFHPFDLRQ
ncbi:MAG: hypothetical protein VW835_12340 [Rickettsiales bacterium]